MLVHQIPPTPPYLRAKIVRRLARVGAVAVKNASGGSVDWTAATVNPYITPTGGTNVWRLTSDQLRRLGGVRQRDGGAVVHQIGNGERDGRRAGACVVPEE